MLAMLGQGCAHVDLKYSGHRKFAETGEREVSVHLQRQMPHVPSQALGAVGGCQGVQQA